MFANQILQSFNRFGLGNVELHRRLADVKIHFPGRAADVTEIRIGHFAGAVHDASHDRDLHSLQVDGRGFDPRGRGLQIEERPAAGRAGDIVGLENPGASRLENVVRQAQGLAGPVLALHQNGVADAVAKERADVRRGGQEGGQKFRVGILGDR